MFPETDLVFYEAYCTSDFLIDYTIWEVTHDCRPLTHQAIKIKNNWYTAVGRFEGLVNDRLCLSWIVCFHIPFNFVVIVLRLMYHLSLRKFDLTHFH